MAAGRWNQRFFASTRGRIVALLRRATGTVDDLARALGLTDNAVRAHLTTLERDGLVEQRGARRGTSKPSTEYGLTPAADGLFPKAYAPVLGHILNALRRSESPEKVEAVLRDAGHRIAAAYDPDATAIEARAAVAVEVLNDLGGLAEYTVVDGAVTIRGYNCPLAAVTAEHPEVCRLAETLVSDLVGVPMHEACVRDGQPRCIFVGTLPGA
jgi:predicted ArsR family transcriptional regulator